MRLHMVTIAAGLAVCVCFGQSAAPPEFEVASVKPNKSVRNGIGNRYEPQRMMWTNAPLRVLIEESFGVRPYEIIGGPGWIDVEKWDIAATTSTPTTSSQKLSMLQTLLIRRFQLQYHRETRILPIFELVLDKHGSKLTEHTANGGATGVTPGIGRLTGMGISASELAFWLSSQLGKRVNDKTGLTEKYDFDLRWKPDDIGTTGPEASIFTAVQDLGLKLSAVKAPTEVFVIDGVERPSEN